MINRRSVRDRNEETAEKMAECRREIQNKNSGKRNLKSGRKTKRWAQLKFSCFWFVHSALFEILESDCAGRELTDGITNLAVKNLEYLSKSRNYEYQEMLHGFEEIILQDLWIITLK